MTPTQQDVVAQDAKLVGDEVNDEKFVVEPEVNTEAVPAQVAQPRESDPAQVPVHETYVATDEVITDPSDPRAVQVPDAGRGSLDLPIHALAEGHVEDKFSADASKPDEEPEAPAEGDDN
jgi:hypothetical protein